MRVVLLLHRAQPGQVRPVVRLLPVREVRDRCSSRTRLPRPPASAPPARQFDPRARCAAPARRSTGSTRARCDARTPSRLGATRFSAPPYESISSAPDDAPRASTTERNFASCAVVGTLRDVVRRADERLVPRRGAARQRVPQAAGPALDEIEPRRGAGRQLRRGRAERRERRLERRLAAEVLPEHLHRRPARPGGEPAERAECVRLVAAPTPRKLATTCSACAHGQVAMKYEPCDTACVRKTSRVTIPKLPPPPPRHAQNRSAWWFLSATRTLPSAVTICTETRLSEASPQARDASPKPPPSAWPPMPTLGHVPAGIASPCAARPL